MIKKKKSMTPAGPRTNLKAARRMLKGLGQNDKWWRPSDGENVIRILPANTEDGNFAFEQNNHFGFKVAGEKRAFPCMISLGHDTCPACQLIAAYEDDDDDDVKAILDKLKPSKYFLMNVIDRNSNKPGVRIYQASPGAMRGILDIFSDSDYGDITDPIKGRDVKIRKTGSDKQTRYKIMVRPNVSKVGLADWVSQLFDLKKEAYREIPTMKEYITLLDDSFGDILDVKEVLRGINSKKKAKDLDLGEDDEEDEEGDIEDGAEEEDVETEDESDEDSEEDEDDEEDEEDEEDESELVVPKKNIKLRKKVVKKVVKKRKPIEDDDEEEDEDDDE